MFAPQYANSVKLHLEEQIIRFLDKRFKMIFGDWTAIQSTRMVFKLVHP